VIIETPRRCDEIDLFRILFAREVIGGRKKPSCRDPTPTDFFLPSFEAFKNASNQKHARQRVAQRFYFVRRFREAALEKIF